METFWYMGKRYREVKAREVDSCRDCDLKPPLGEVCYINIWSDRKEVQVICGIRDVIFKEVP